MSRAQSFGLQSDVGSLVGLNGPPPFPATFNTTTRQLAFSIVSSTEKINMSQQIWMRASRQIGLQARNPTLRSAFQRRLASTQEQAPLTGAADNAFNRERRAVKAHAAASSGQSIAPKKQSARVVLTTMPDTWRKLSI